MIIKVNDLYGIKNEIKIEFKNSAIIFAPNGTGKTSLTKGFRGSKNGILKYNLEGNTPKPQSMTIDNIPITNYSGVKVFNSTDLDSILSDPIGIIRSFMEYEDGRKKIRVIPVNIYENYINTYEKIVDELQSYNIEFQKIEITDRVIDCINQINNIISETDKVTKNELIEIKKKYIYLSNSHEILKSSKIKNYKDLIPKFNKTIENIYDENISIDFDIMSNIIERDRGLSFAYKIGEEYKSVNSIFEEIKLKALKNGFTESEIKALITIQEIDNVRMPEKVVTTSTSNAQRKYLIKEMTFLGNKIHNILIKNQENDFDKHQREIKRNESKYINKYNYYVNTFNNEFLKVKNLKWNIQIKKISKYHEKTSISILDGGVKRTASDLEEFASEGQKRIIAIMLASMPIDESHLIVFDDIVSSLDSDNIAIFKDIIDVIARDKKRNFILLTHSYDLLVKISTIGETASFFAMEEVSKKKIIFPFEGKHALILPELFSSIVSNNCDKTLFASTVLREVIDNYIIRGYDKRKNTDIKSRLVDFKSDLELYYRHYKNSNHTFKFAGNYFSNEYEDILEMFSDDLIKSLTNNDSEEKISEYVLNYKISDNFLNLLDYITQKYLNALKIRFVFEKNTYNSLSSEFRENWDNNEIKGMLSNKEVLDSINSEKIDIFKRMFSHNHLNNLRWTPVVEMPIYKIEKYFAIIDDKNNYLK